MATRSAATPLRRVKPRPKRLSALVFVAWCASYFEGEQADHWRVAGLGDCERCGHRLIHHGGYACAACGVDPTVAWDERCRAPLPDPE